MTLSRLAITTAADLADAFGMLGTKVGLRLGPDGRTHEQKEWWCLRRYVFTLAANVEFPIIIEKGERPDFRCSFGSRRLGIEVSEATDTRDQREMDEFERTGATALLGTFGGRFKNGAAKAERAWLADVLRRVRAKSVKISSYERLPSYVVLLYSNSNAVKLTYDWPRVFDGLGPMNQRMWRWLASRCPSLNSVAVICEGWLLVLEPGSVSYYQRRSGIGEEDKMFGGIRARRC